MSMGSVAVLSELLGMVTPVTEMKPWPWDGKTVVYVLAAIPYIPW
jgi:hypothetical protein